MEASALPAPSGLARTRLAIGAPLLRLRSDEQLVSLFRSGNNEAFRVIHDRYRQRLFAYTRQMLPGSRHDAEDALQDVFVRAYNGLRANDRELALRAWLYRVAHNRCIDELRRPVPPAPEVLELVRPPVVDPIEEAEQRESLRRLVADVRRLPEQQRSALLMRELGGMSYVEVAAALGVSVAAVKSLLVRARVGLAQAAVARDAPCFEIREELIVAHDRGVRATGMARRHMRDCPSCREFRGQLRGTSKQFHALLPALGPAGALAKLLGFGGGAGGGTAAVGGGTAAVGGGAAAASGLFATGGSVASVGVLATGAGHVATVLAAAVVTAGGAVEIQHTITPAHHPAHHRIAAVAAKQRPRSTPAVVAFTPVTPVSPAAPRAHKAPPAVPAVAAPAKPAPDALAPASAPTRRRAGVKHRVKADPNNPWLPPQPQPNLNAPYRDSSSTGQAGTLGTTSSTSTTASGQVGSSTSGGSNSSVVGSGAPGTTATGGAVTPSTPASGGASSDGSGSSGQTDATGTQGSVTSSAGSGSATSGGSPSGAPASTGSTGSTSTS